jgi:hypothetical protein
MSKKSRRFRTPNLPPEAYAAVTSPGAAAEAPAAVANAASSPVAAAEGALDLSGEYKDVIGDLRKTFIIFISMVVVMLALSFVI